MVRMQKFELKVQFYLRMLTTLRCSTGDFMNMQDCFNLDGNRMYTPTDNTRIRTL